MDDLPVQMLDVGEGATRRRIATFRRPGEAPGLIWLCGLKSDCHATKALAIDQFGATRGLAVTRFDYSGHGSSDGAFIEGTMSRWLEETLAVFGTTQGPQILVGSSLGGYIALLASRHLMAHAPADAARISALLLIAPAWNMTEELMWTAFPPSAKAAIERDGVYLRPSEYGEPYPLSRALFEDGRKHLISRDLWRIGRPVTIVHGLQDQDVPWEHTLDLASFLDGDDINVIAVPDGEHRLSTPEHITTIEAALGELVAKVGR